MAEPLWLADLEARDPRAAQGIERRFLCPFCGEGKPKDSAHRSMNVNTQTGAFVCQRCEARGKLADFWAERPKLGGRDFARQQLRRATELPPTEPAAPDESAIRKAHELAAKLEALQPLEGTSGAAYLFGRGVSLEIARAAGVKFSPNWFGRGAVVFSIRDRAGEVVAAQGRHTTGAGKFSFGPKSQGLFMAAGALDIPAFIVTEAPIDALSLAAAGFPAVALCGKTGPAWLPKFCFGRRVFLAFDADQAGDDAADEMTPSLESFGAVCARIRPENAKDWNEFLQFFGRDALADFLAGEVLRRC
jgi:DNA primase